MPFIKELVIHGFKSFARETRIPFKNTMNVIVGPNGSGKSNVTDAICFVLGRLGSKSMRAKKLSNLIFAGTEKYKPAHEAMVKLVFDNTDKGFSLSNEEVVIERVLRKNGQGVYKINDEVKTRQEILELLVQAGIDPNGFNIVLQGEIDSFVKMPPDQRREVIEEVAGIGVYEMRKQKSLAELEKTDERLKEANAILRERTAYLKNLEDERRQALQFKKLQEEVVVCKASIANKQLSEKNEALEEINKSIEREENSIRKIREVIEKTEQEIAILNQKINDISSNVQKSSGLEQDQINREIADLRADLAGLNFKKNDFENKISEMEKRKSELGIMIQTAEHEILELSKSKGKSVKKDLDLKKQQLDQMDEQRRKLYILKSQLGYLVSRIDEKQKQIQRIKNDYENTYGKIQQMESEISIKDSAEVHKEKIVILKTNLEKSRLELTENTKKRNDCEKTIAICEKEIENQKKIQSQVSQLDICPLCKTKITQDHINHVITGAKKLVEDSENKISSSEKSIKQLHELNERQSEIIFKIENEIKQRSQDLLRLDLINEKKELLRKFTEELKILQKEAQDLEKKKDKMEDEVSSLKTSETNYDNLRLEVQELQRHEESHVGTEVTLKQRGVERNKNILKEIAREFEEISQSLEEVSKLVEEKQTLLEEKSDQDQLLKDKYRKALEEKNKLQERVHFFERDLMHKQNDKHAAEERINNSKIERAQLNAQRETFELEAKSYGETRVMRASIDELRKRIEELQNTIARIGTVNLKALEVYENVKIEYDKVQEKVNKIQEEKLEILKVIEDIDKKKKKVFLQTLEELNKLFSRNFSQLSTKGTATLEPVDKEDIFKAGVEMLIKVGKGKYFDTHSLSGGEQSLISLSLIFAIQEYKPYPFYIFDEIDAALDRRNSERLAALLKRYMNKGQYIIITHNDSLITESPVIYGVSMQEKISKVVSLEV
ncbi:chromosome segregation protein SMC [Candidatus Pacearchaeota archaeon]|nr:chromosome segregation protein SMC [Candidatus Pacearchaeota archaeon]